VTKPLFDFEEKTVIPGFQSKTAMVALLLAGAALQAAEAQPGTVPATGPVAEYQSDPKYQAKAPVPRGKVHQPPGGILSAERNPVLWGWRLTLPDGRGLGFGGISLRTEDPRPETEVLRDGKWTPIHAELRRQNPLQDFSDRLSALRTPLQRVAGLARHGYLEGLDAKAEAAHLAKEAVPLAADVAGKLTELDKALAGFKTQDTYLAGQIAFARSYLAKTGPALEGLAAGLSDKKFEALRQARINLEIAAEALDAAPPARALSQIAYDAKTGFFVIFGGDHLDYLTNDLWVFEPAAQRWRQKHPAAAPEPRAEHFLSGGEPGKVVMKGGYIYGRKQPGWDSSTYVGAGPEEWSYDLAANTWSGPTGLATFPADTRHYREGAFLPDHFTSGSRPDPAAHAKKLAELPANTWVPLKPLKTFAWNRDWGTVILDPDRDLLYWYSGGHSAYPGSDVAHYHLATNTWDQPVETELPPGFIGTNEPMIGWSFNRRPWMGHQYRSFAYHPELKKLVMNGRQRTNPPIDQFCYFYDPDLGDWVSRKRTPEFFGRHGAQLFFSKEAGMVTWYNKVWQLDAATLDWKQLAVQGKLRGPVVDYSGSVYDDRRGRALIFASTGYAKPFDGEVHALDLTTLAASAFKPEGSEHIPALTNDHRKHFWHLREIARHPELDLFLFAALLPGDYIPALDPAKNRWVGLKIAGDFPRHPSMGMVFDRKRGLFYIAETRAQVFALRIDPKTVVIKTFAEIAAELPPAGAPPAGK